VFYLILVICVGSRRRLRRLARKRRLYIFTFIFYFLLSQRREQTGSTHVDDLLEDGPWTSRKWGVLRVEEMTGVVECASARRKTILATFYWFSQLWRDCERCGFGSASLSITPLNFQRRSLESSNEFSFYVTRGCVERTGKRWSPTQVDFEPSFAQLGSALRHVDGSDTNVTRGFERRRTVLNFCPAAT